MTTKGFRFQVFLRVILMIGFAFSGVYILLNTHVWLVAMWLFLGFLLSVISLIRYVEKSNRELKYFLLSVAQGDYSNAYNYKKKEELNYAFDTLNEVLKNLRNEKASNLIYLQTVVEHIGTALICFDDNFRIILHNKAANQLFQKDHLTTVNSIAGYSLELDKKVKEMSNGQKELIKVKIAGEEHNLSVQATEFWLTEDHYKLVSFQDIRSELEVKELESWQKLIRVLTHEIKNSVIPISTLSDVIIHLMKDKEDSFSKLGEEESFGDILGGLETIQARSEGLANFVKTYDQLTKIPSPELEILKPDTLISRVLTLFKPELEQKNMEIEKSIDNSISIKADPNLMDQVLVNLIKNAMDALDGSANPKIKVECAAGYDQASISVSDNGSGIPAEIMDNIFVPFYTTKESGSGIGLALSRQILKVQKGTISAKSNARGTTFTIHLPLSTDN